MRPQLPVPGEKTADLASFGNPRAAESPTAFRGHSTRSLRIANLVPPDQPPRSARSGPQASLPARGARPGKRTAEVGRACLRADLRKVAASAHDPWPAQRSRRLILEWILGFTLALVSSGERKRRQPRLAPHRPEFVGRPQLIGRIERSDVHFDFACATRENRRAAAWTEKSSEIAAGLALDRDCLLRKYGRSMKQGAMMLAAVETVAKADAVRPARRRKPDVAAQATAREPFHAGAPSARDPRGLRR